MRRGPNNDWFDTAQICLNGHVVNDQFEHNPHMSKQYCNRCGADTTTQCRKCMAQIRGYWHIPGFATGSLDSPPAFCEACGKPFSWTESRLEAARDLADQLSLDVPERALLEKSIEELLRDTPRAPAEAVRFKAIVENAKPWGLEAFKQVLGAAISEGAKKLIWPT